MLAAVVLPVIFPVTSVIAVSIIVVFMFTIIVVLLV